MMRFLNRLFCTIKTHIHLLNFSVVDKWKLIYIWNFIFNTNMQMKSFFISYYLYIPLLFPETEGEFNIGKQFKLWSENGISFNDTFMILITMSIVCLLGDVKARHTI